MNARLAVADRPGGADKAPVPDGRAGLPLSTREFNIIRALAKARIGIVLADHKRDMVVRRLSRRVRALGLRSFKDYCGLVSGPDADREMGMMINALTTNLTKFFREKHHFDHLASVALPRLLTRFRAEGTRRLRLWSAGCSSGEEPYSIAMTLLGSMLDLGQWNAKILATDIDTDMVEKGRSGIYDARIVDSIPAAERKKFVEPLGGPPGGSMGDDERRYRIAQPLRSLVAFKQLNLLHAWPMKGPFDIIFCRNVVIYFDKETQRELFNRYADILRDGSFLYIGHSESLYKVSERFRLIGQSIYEKIE